MVLNLLVFNSSNRSCLCPYDKSLTYVLCYFRDQMDLEVKSVFLDHKDLQDHKDPVDFLFKGFQWDLKNQ